MKAIDFTDYPNESHKNQFIVYHKGVVYFQSYDTLMATLTQSFEGSSGKTLEMNSHYWSATTGKHMKSFLEETNMLNTVLDLIHKYKLFNNIKDFMERANIVKVLKGIITVDYTNEKGETVVYTCL